MEKLNLNNKVAFGLIVIQNFTLNSMFIYFILSFQAPQGRKNVENASIIDVWYIINFIALVSAHKFHYFNNFDHI